MPNRRKSTEELRENLGLTESETRSRSVESRPSQSESDQTPQALSSTQHDELNRVFELLVDEGYQITPNYRIEVDQWGRPHLTMTVTPPSAFGSASESESESD